jgi:hypothetical protein
LSAMAVAAISMTKVAVPIIGSSSQAAIFLPAPGVPAWADPEIVAEPRRAAPDVDHEE